MAEKKSGRFTDEERAAMKQRAQELRSSDSSREADAENEVLEKIAEMQPADRAMAQRVHAIIKASLPDVEAKTWYGMPAYAKDGRTICFFQPAQKFKTRYATLGFSDKAHLDDGAMWPNAYALTEVTPAVEKRIVALVRQAVS